MQLHFFFLRDRKSIFLKGFFEYSKFIAVRLSGPFSGVLSQSNLQEASKASLLIFIRLVGCAYFKKHANAFFSQTPFSLMNSMKKEGLTPEDHHRQWLDYIRQTIWDRISTENDTIPPSFEALQYHWLRSCWVIHMWHQAESNAIILALMNVAGEIITHWKSCGIQMKTLRVFKIK